MFAAHDLLKDPANLRLIYLLMIAGALLFWQTLIRMIGIAMILLIIWYVVGHAPGMHLPG